MSNETGAVKSGDLVDLENVETVPSPTSPKLQPAEPMESEVESKESNDSNAEMEDASASSIQTNAATSQKEEVKPTDSEVCRFRPRVGISLHHHHHYLPYMYPAEVSQLAVGFVSTHVVGCVALPNEQSALFYSI